MNECPGGKRETSSVLIISYHFYPSNEIGARRPTALARFLVNKGIRVAVVSAFGGQDVEPGSEVVPGVVAVPVRKPTRVFTDAAISLKRRIQKKRTDGRVQGGAKDLSSSRRAPSMSFSSRIRNLYFRVANFVDEYKSWGRRAYKAAVHEGRTNPPGLIFSTAPPPTVLWVGALVARRLRVPHISDLRDPWSDAIDLRSRGSIERAMLGKLEAWVMRTSAAITSTGARVAQLLIQRQPILASKMFVVRNGYDESVGRSSSETGGRLTILFAGELYLNRDPFPLLCALERLLSLPEVDPSRVRMTFMGRKAEYAGRSIADWLKGKRCATVVKLLPPQPPEIVAEKTLESSVVLNLAQQQPLSIPAKTFEHLASGRENLLLCENDSESADLVARIPGVVQVDSNDAKALDRALLDLYDRHVNQGRLRAPAENDVAAFSRGAANDVFWQVMKQFASIES